MPGSELDTRVCFTFFASQVGLQKVTRYVDTPQYRKLQASHRKHQSRLKQVRPLVVAGSSADDCLVSIILGLNP